MTTDLRTRTVRTAAILGLFAIVGATLVIGLSAGVSATGRTNEHDSHHVSHAAATDDAPPPSVPSMGSSVGLLGMNGQPVVGLDGQPLEVPVQATTPGPAANPLAPLPGNQNPGEDIEVLTLGQAHARTLDDAATTLGFTLVQRHDLFARNGLLADRDGDLGRLAELRSLIVRTARSHGSFDEAAACKAADEAAARLDGQGDDLVAGDGAPFLHSALDDTRRELGC